jgi:hypothetical protein
VPAGGQLVEPDATPQQRVVGVASWEGDRLPTLGMLLDRAPAGDIAAVLRLTGGEWDRLMGCPRDSSPATAGPPKTPPRQGSAASR